ncbi:MAG: helicase C-terminal domain-containing protein [Promethearchaeota archaeon]
MDYSDIFPYRSYRRNQENVIKTLYKALQSQEHSLLIAPNGTGKTICNLAAAIPIITKSDLRLVYLSRTHTQSARVIEEINRINENTSLGLSAVSLRGRKEMCIHRTVQKIKGSPTDIMNICSDLRKNGNCKYFNKVSKLKNDSKLDKIIHKTSNEAQELIALCKDQGLCPYFLARYLMEEAKIIVCNYQWIFNPIIRNAFLGGAKIEDLSKTIIIMDECHNLADFLADIDSSRLTTYSLQQARKELRSNRAHIDYIRLVDAWIDIIEKLQIKVKKEELKLFPLKVLQRIAKEIQVGNMGELLDAVVDLKEYGEGLLHERISAGLNPIDYIGTITQFMEKLIDIKDKKNYFFCIVPKHQKMGDITFHLEIVALDPIEISKPIFTNSYATCSCSGTLNAETYTQILGLSQLTRKTTVVEVSSPFPKNHVKAILLEQLNTKLSNRTDETFQKMNEMIAEVLFNTPKNVGIFCATYGILNSLVKNGLLDLVRFSNKDVFIEDAKNSASENAMLVDSFKSSSKKRGAVLLGVCGGRNSEGEDFPGDYMNASVVVGLPFHRPTPRTTAKIKYYDTKFGSGKGWNYAYLEPAIKRANQAAGRPIRKLEDKGAIILMDNRYTKYKHLLSKWIVENLITVPNEPNKIGEQLESFF